MIGKLSGNIEYKNSDYVLIDINGVGYMVYCSNRTLASLPGKGEPVSLYTDLLVKEDILQLFGFTTLLEKEWHRLLMGVQGIGAKAAIAILGAIGPEGVTRAIAMGDWGSIKVAKGVGPKTAQRVVIELKDKAPIVMAYGDMDLLPLNSVVNVEDFGVFESSESSISASLQAEALSGLVNLGYSSMDAAQAIARATIDVEIKDTSNLIRLALRQLAPND
ncbi:MAG: Holliday junction branch migration protein RuvA [Proteobacteria bacterium]|jgi:Holliday junction DNA helicase RuvA|nr:Holliday junction branch migration protein RuvA [Pseudomonadota bacterium]MDA1239107.1 Holliday junction branch migration protein RuvA [Pseudomonadota bacterium]